MRARYFLLGLVCAMTLGGCVSSRHLQEGEKVLSNQRITGKKGVSSRALRALFLQKDNARLWLFPWYMPYVELYRFGLSHYSKKKYERKIAEYDSIFNAKILRYPQRVERLRARKRKVILGLSKKIKEGNGWMRIGKPMELYHEETIFATAQKLRAHLQQQGFLRSKVDVAQAHKKKGVRVTYQLDMGPLYVIDSISYHVADQELLSFLEPNFMRSIVQQGRPYRQGTLVEAREYAHRYLLNRGFYNFPIRNIRFVVDTLSLEDHRVWLQVHIDPVQEDYAIKPQVFDSIQLQVGGAPLDSTSAHNGIFFNTNRNRRLLSERMLFRSGQNYSVKRYEQSLFMLNELDIFRSIDSFQDTSSRGVKTRIELTAYEKYVLDSNLGLEVSQGLPSPFFSVNIKARNAFRMLDIMECFARIALDGTRGPTASARSYGNYEYSLQFRFGYPDILFPRWKNKAGTYFQKRTLFSFALVVNNHPDYFRAHNTFRISYVWKHTKQLRYELAFVDLNLVAARISPRFFQQIRTFYNSFSNSFQSGIVNLMSLDVTWDKEYVARNAKGYLLRGGLEVGGHLKSLLQDFAEQNNLAQYIFSRATFEYRHRVPVLFDQDLVWRMRIGIIVPYGVNNALPYEKFFFTGGSNSMRAWLPRRLGPGRYRLSNASAAVEQPGQFLLEGNIEYRFHLGGRWGGAIFTDVGNVWFLKGHLGQGATFGGLSSLQDVGVASGFGLRIDLSLFILRLDLAFRMYDPVFVAEKRFSFLEIRPSDFLLNGNDRVLLNIAINYPF